jgi:hypothetical protein
MNSKKLVSAALTVATVLALAGSALLPSVAGAQTTTSSLATTIASLQAQIASLTAELNSSSGSTTTGTTYNFTSDLTVGSTGSAVTALQQFLIGQGDLVLATPTTYFGSLTQAALAKFQAAHNITPSVGYFGAKTRAFVNSLSTSSTTTTTTTTTTYPAGCTSAAGFSPTTGAPCSTTTTTTGVTAATGAAMSVAVDSQTPGATHVADGAVNTPVLKLDFTAGATPVTVTNLVLTRSGLSQDSDLNNVYLYSGATKLASNLGFNNGAITFSNGAGLFTVPANSTMVVTVTVDVAGSSANSSGHIFQIGLASSSAVTGGTFTGNFPLNGSQFTIASVTNLATLTITSATSTASTTVNAGQLNDLVGQMTVQAGNNPVKVTSVTFTNIGSVTPSYLQNVKLMNGSTQLGATISSLASNNIATFDLSGAPLMLTSGQSAVLSLYADITGGVNRTFQFSVQQSSDIQAVDTTYGVGIGASIQSVSNNGGFPVTFSNTQINNGGVVASRDPASPTTNVVAGNTNQILAEFDVLASGDSIKFNQISFTVSGNQTINNFRVIDDQGAQIGTTVTATSTAVSEGSGSLNYIIPANTTRVLTVYGDLSSTSTGSVGVTFGTSGTSAQSYTTYVSASVASVPGNTLNVLPAGSNLLVSENYGLGTPVSAAAGAQAVRIGSYTLTAGQVNPINLTGVTIAITGTTLTNNPTWLTNLQVFDGSTQLGQTYATVAGGNTYSFNGNSPIAIAANGSVTLDVYANISSNISSSTATTTVGGVTSLYSVNASTLAGNAVTASSTHGQDLAFNTGGALVGSVSAGRAQASYLGMNVPGVNVAQYQFAADNNGSETLTQVQIIDSASATTTATPGHTSDIINYRLTNTSGDVLSTASEGSNGLLTFNLSGVVVPVNYTQYLNLVADTNSYPYAISGGTHAYYLSSYQYTNATQSQTTTTTISNGMANLFTVYQTTLGVTATSGWSTPNNISGVGNIIGEFTISAGSGNLNPTVNSITLGAAGSLIPSSTMEYFGLYDASAPQVLLASSSATGVATTTFYLGSVNSSQWVIPHSGSATLLVKTLKTPTGPALGSTLSGSNTGSYQIVLTGLTWTDGPSVASGTTVTSSSVDTSIGLGLSPSVALPLGSTNVTGLTN